MSAAYFALAYFEPQKKIFKLIRTRNLLSEVQISWNIFLAVAVKQQLCA